VLTDSVNPLDEVSIRDGQSTVKEAGTNGLVGRDSAEPEVQLEETPGAGQSSHHTRLE
jgi:hypothetical protein